MKKVYLLWHILRADSGAEEEKLIGVYSSKQSARIAIHEYIKKDGFKDSPEGFEIVEYTIDKDEWQEGFVTVYP
ncbi:hypothetical protein LJC24_00410 [Desulfococcaceae bacterium OttesenSCG-928-F15]|nr:hypothetical protein [Desulfococcaceae bacterium OttesenSCG-928-F15]